jgi:hypothetical protein
MHGSFFAITALDLARERTLEGERRSRLLRGAGPVPRTLPRRVLGRLAAWIGQPAAALAARRRDGVAIGGGTSA